MLAFARIYVDGAFQHITGVRPALCGSPLAQVLVGREELKIAWPREEKE